MAVPSDLTLLSRAISPDVNMEVVVHRAIWGISGHCCSAVCNLTRHSLGMCMRGETPSRVSAALGVPTLATFSVAPRHLP